MVTSPGPRAALLTLLTLYRVLSDEGCESHSSGIGAECSLLCEDHYGSHCVRNGYVGVKRGLHKHKDVLWEWVDGPWELGERWLSVSCPSGIKVIKYPLIGNMVWSQDINRPAAASFFEWLLDDKWQRISSHNAGLWLAHLASVCPLIGWLGLTLSLIWDKWCLFPGQTPVCLKCLLGSRELGVAKLEILFNLHQNWSRETHTSAQTQNCFYIRATRNKRHAGN